MEQSKCMVPSPPSAVVYAQSLIQSAWLSCSLFCVHEQVQSVGGGFTVQRDDPLRFYVGARTGADQLTGNATAGVAELRRDGFASVSVSTGATHGVLVTRPVQFSGTHLFVNGDNVNKIKVAILDAVTATALPQLGIDDYAGVVGSTTSGTLLELRWAGGPNALNHAVNKSVRVQFSFQDDSAQLFSFWFAPSTCGASSGWLGAGGIGYNSSRDTMGQCQSVISTNLLSLQSNL